MYARVTRVHVNTDKVEEAILATQQEITPDMENDPGFKGAYILADRETGDSLAITMWEDLETEQASKAMVAKRLGMLAQYMDREPEPSVTYEVIASAVPAKQQAV